ncbi:MAG: hypothetical protein ABI625_07195 [bacterium]
MTRLFTTRVGARVRYAGVVLLSLVMGSNVQAQAVSAAAAALGRARVALDSGQFLAAEGFYNSTIELALDSRLKSDGYFGRAYAAQRRLLADRDSLTAADARKIADDYRLAGELSPSIALDAASNAVVALQAAGLKAAADSFRLAAIAKLAGGPGGNGPLRPIDAPSLVRLGELFEKQGMRDSARSYFSRALRSDSSSTDALRALLRFNSRSGNADSVLRISSVMLKRPAAAQLVEGALLDLLDTPLARGRIADSSLVLCARAWAVMGLGPASFALSEETRLRRILEKNPEVRPIIEPMLDAYRPRKNDERFRDTSPWWRKDVGRRAAWSQMLRSLGDSYSGSGDPLVAESFYEAAVGLPNPSFEQAWIDLDALLPLAQLYAQRAEGRKQSDELVTRVDELTNMLFYGKMRAIEAADYQRIRYFHMTLGAMFAAQERWGDGPRGAIYQLENMRRMTVKANQTANAGLSDPPELLEKLAKGYVINKDAANARRTAADAVEAYKRLGRTTDAARVSTQILNSPTSR